MHSFTHLRFSETEQVNSFSFELPLQVSHSAIDLIGSLFIFFFLPLLCFLFFFSIASAKSSSPKLPRSFPLIGSYPAIFANRKRRIQWISDLVRLSPSATYVLRRPLGSQTQVFTGNPDNVRHILKTHFANYQKGKTATTLFHDLLGDGIFNVNGDSWKFQRQVASHEFNTKSLRKFIETVVDKELNDRLIPILSEAARNGTILDMQDILQRFAFDNICNIAFGHDPAYLSPSLQEEKFAEAFEEAVKISSERFSSAFPIIWKLKNALNIGSEKRLKAVVSEVRQFAKYLVREKKKELQKKPSSLESEDDLLSRFLSSGHSDENFVSDIVISFILAGRDTTSAALIWYFWLLYNNPPVENEVLNEIKEKSESLVMYNDVKNMVYTHASLCESMRLYPPVPIDTKEAVTDDVLPDGTVIKKGMRVAYHPYAMGRLEQLWGSDWKEFKPKRWLEKADCANSGNRVFIGRDSFIYSVFQAGPRICLGKEMAFLQMKRVAAGVLQRFKVIPAFGEGVEPLFISYLSSKMQGGFPVRIKIRED